MIVSKGARLKERSKLSFKQPEARSGAERSNPDKTSGYSRHVRSCVCLFIYLATYLSVFVSISYLSIHRSIGLSAYLSGHVCVYVSISIYMCICMKAEPNLAAAALKPSASPLNCQAII